MNGSRGRTSKSRLVTTPPTDEASVHVRGGDLGDRSGQPIAGAAVAFVDSDGVAYLTQTDRDGTATGPAPATVHVVVPPGSYRPRRRGLVVHVRDIAAHDVVQYRGLPLTCGAQTWLDLAAIVVALGLLTISWRAARSTPAD